MMVWKPSSSQQMVICGRPSTTCRCACVAPSDHAQSDLQHQLSNLLCQDPSHSLWSHTTKTALRAVSGRTQIILSCGIALMRSTSEHVKSSEQVLLGSVMQQSYSAQSIALLVEPLQRLLTMINFPYVHTSLPHCAPLHDLQ